MSDVHTNWLRKLNSCYLEEDKLEGRAVPPASLPNAKDASLHLSHSPGGSPGPDSGLGRVVEPRREPRRELPMLCIGVVLRI